MAEADAPKNAGFPRCLVDVMEEKGKIVLFNEKFASWEEALEAFILFRKAEGYSKRTIEDYRYHITHLFKERPQAWDPACPSRAKAAVLSYLAQDGIAPATFNLRLNYIKAFFSWLVAEGAFPENPAWGIKRRKAEPRIVQHKVKKRLIRSTNLRKAEPRIVQHSAEVLEKLLKLPDKSTYCGKRDYALICLSIDTAIRPGEALALTLDDVDLDDLTVLVRASVSKTRKSRTLPFSVETAKALQAMIASRPKEWDTPLLFTNHEGERLTASGWRQRLKKIYAPKLGLKRLSPYDLRHDAALYFLRNGMNPFALQAIMGHSNLETTKHYIALVEADIREAQEKASPVRKLLGGKKRIR
jgi:site-specific recombinase XerD